MIELILEKARTGTRVIYIPGNHDEMLRHYCGSAFGNVEVHRRFIHQLADGRRLLLLHGDEFDHVIQCGRLLALIGAVAYECLTCLNRYVNGARRWLGAPYWSLSSYLKTRVKQAREHIEKFEQAVVSEARRYQVDGIVCGHIHHAELSLQGDILYCNDGDWVENCTSLVETHHGRLEILHWADRQKTVKAHEPDRVAA